MKPGASLSGVRGKGLGVGRGLGARGLGGRVGGKEDRLTVSRLFGLI